MFCTSHCWKQNVLITLFVYKSCSKTCLFTGVTFKAHRIILAACSKHFHDLFEAAPPCPNILVILDGTSSSNMSALLEFMYKGEVHVKHESLFSFLKAAECLQVRFYPVLFLKFPSCYWWFASFYIGYENLVTTLTPFFQHQFFSPVYLFQHNNIGTFNSKPFSRGWPTELLWAEGH